MHFAMHAVGANGMNMEVTPILKSLGINDMVRFLPSACLAV